MILKNFLEDYELAEEVDELYNTEELETEEVETEEVEAGEVDIQAIFKELEELGILEAEEVEAEEVEAEEVEAEEVDIQAIFKEVEAEEVEADFIKSIMEDIEISINKQLEDKRTQFVKTLQGKIIEGMDTHKNIFLIEKNKIYK